MNTRHISVLALLAASLAGCGGGGGSSSSVSSKGRGRVVATVTWPVQTRLIPQASNSIVVTLVGTSNSVSQTRSITRTETTVSFDDVPVGTYTVRADAKPNADGTGVTQATGSQSITVNAGATTPFDFTMNSLATRLRIGLGTGSPLTYTFTPNGTGTSTLVSSNGLASGSAQALPTLTGTTPLTLDLRNDQDQLILVNAGASELTATGGSTMDCTTEVLGASTTYSLVRLNNADEDGEVTATYRDNKTSDTGTEILKTFRLPFLVFRSFTTTSFPAAAAIDAAPNGVGTNGATAEFRGFSVSNAGAVTASAGPFPAPAGFVAGDDIRTAATATRTLATKVGSGAVSYTGTDGGSKTVTGVTNIQDITVVEGRVFLLADFSGGRKIVEIPAAPTTPASAAVTPVNPLQLGAGSLDVSGATNLSAARRNATTLDFVVQRAAKVERYSVTLSLVATENTAFNAKNIAPGRDIAATDDYTFVMDTVGRIHTYNGAGVEYGLNLALPAGTVGRRLAAGRSGGGEERLYIIATSTGLTGSEVTTFSEAG